MIRLRLLFGKTVLMRYTSHLDTQRALERTIRRAQLPLAYSEGFTPHAKIHFASALPLGYISIGELADIWLTEEITAEECLRALIRMPTGKFFFRLISLNETRPAALSTAVFIDKPRSVEADRCLLASASCYKRRDARLICACLSNNCMKK